MNKSVLGAFASTLILLAACGGNETEAPAAETAAVETPEVVTPAVDPAIVAVIEARQARFKKMGKNFKTVVDNVKAGTPESEAVIAATQILAEMAPDVKTWFPAGSGPETDIKMEAKAEIWDQPEAFAEALTKFETAIAALSAAVDSGEGPAIMGAVQPVGKTCGGCHDDFRVDD